MSVARKWHWTCDACKTVAVREDQGLPKGWVFVKATPITHRCQECKNDVPLARHGFPEITAEK